MVSTLVFSITTAGLLFLVLGERLGLPAPLGLLALQALLALSFGLMIVLSATNRLDPFLAERPRAQAFGRVARLAILLLAGLAASGGVALENPVRAGSLIAGYGLGTIALLPREAGFGVAGGKILAMGGMLRRLALAIMSLALITLWLPLASVGFAAILQREAEALRGPILLASVLGVALGGATGLSRLARAILLLGLVLAVAPLGGAAFVERAFPPESLQGTLATMLQEASSAIPSGQWREGLPDLLAGFVIGGLGSALRPARERVGQSILVALLALVIALAGALFVMMEVIRLHEVVVTQIAGQPPARWPLFAFDEAILGWLKVCGEAPRDVLDAFRACRARGYSVSFPISELRLEPGLIGPAIAASRGLPVVLAAGWMLAAPLICLVAIGLLMHGAALLISETSLYRRAGEKALRSSRLLLARFLVLAPMALLFLLPAEAALQERPALSLMLGTLLLIIVARLADLLRAGVRALRSREPHALPITPSAEAI
jgi:hypothetical protein